MNVITCFLNYIKKQGQLLTSWGCKLIHIHLNTLESFQNTEIIKTSNIRKKSAIIVETIQKEMGFLKKF